MTSNQTPATQKGPPDAARVVVIGGGIIGCSIAYQLTKLGWADVVVLERGNLGCGTTWHSHGLVGLIRSSPIMTKLALRTTEILKELDRQGDQATGFRQNGTIVLATEGNQLERLRRLSSSMRFAGLDLHEIAVDEAARRWPLARTDDALGAFFMPAEGQTNALDTLQAYAKAAQRGGAKIFENTKASNIGFEQGRAAWVDTKWGRIKTDFLVNATGMWAGDLTQTQSLSLPIMAVEQSYIVTEPIPDLALNLPIIRGGHEGVSARADARQLTIGAGAARERPWGVEGIPESFSFQELPDDWDVLEPLIERMMYRFPLLENIGIRKIMTGPEASTPDSRYLLGPMPACPNYFVAAGMGSVGVGSSGGIGEEMARWIVEGEPSIDLSELDVRRTMSFETNKRYLEERVAESRSASSKLFWPYLQIETARNIRHSPLHDRLASAKAQFRVRAGWEDADWIAQEAVETIDYCTFSPDPWFEAQKAEHLSPWQSGGLSDLSNHAKFLVQGPDAARDLANILASALPEDPGGHVFSPVIGENDHVDLCVDVCRLSDTEFLILGDPTVQTHLADVLQCHVDQTGASHMVDMTSAYGILGLVGLPGEKIIARISGIADVGTQFLPGSCQPADLGYGKGWILRRGSVALPAWDLILPTEFTVQLFDQINTGTDTPGLIGTRVRRGLFLEAGLHHRELLYPKRRTTASLGLETLSTASRQTDTVTRDDNLCLLPVRLADADRLFFGNEIILLGDRVIGRITDAAFGHRIGVAIGLGSVDPAVKDVSDALRTGKLTTEIAGRRFVLAPINKSRLALSV